MLTSTPRPMPPQRASLVSMVAPAIIGCNGVALVVGFLWWGWTKNSGCGDGGFFTSSGPCEPLWAFVPFVAPVLVPTLLISLAFVLAAKRALAHERCSLSNERRRARRIAQ